jgi:hypothetical protein
LALVQGLVEHGFDYGLAADVEFFGGGFEFFEHGGGESTLTRWMGFIIFPELVKNREMDLPLSAWRAMVSAGMGFFLERALFIETTNQASTLLQRSTWIDCLKSFAPLFVLHSFAAHKTHCHSTQCQVLCNTALASLEKIVL